MNPLLPASFPVPAFKVKTLEKPLVFFGCEMVHFGCQYLGFYSDFVLHIYTHSKGLLVSFLTVYLNF
jgi:hypothetical protein